jgi:hypothetical protein
LTSCLEYNFGLEFSDPLRILKITQITPKIYRNLPNSRCARLKK